MLQLRSHWIIALKFIPIFSLIVSGLIVVPIAFAQEKAPEPVPIPATIQCDTHLPKEFSNDPQQLAMRGIACFEDKQFTKALKFYRLAYKVEPSPVFTAAIGRALQELGLPGLAKPHFIEYLKKAKLNEEGANKINQQLRKIDSDLKNSAELHIYTTEPEATAYLIVAGNYFEELGKTPLSLPLLAGDYEITIKKPGFEAKRITVQLKPEEVREQLIELHSLNEAVHLSRTQWKKTGSYLMYGAAPLLVAGGTLFTIGTLKTSDAKIADGDVRNSLVESGSSFKNYGLLTGATGLLLLGSGIAFYLHGMSGEPHMTLRVSPHSIQYTYAF